MPITILEIPKDSRVDIPQAKELCEKVGDGVHHSLSVPDPKDKENRVTRSVLDKPVLRVSFTVGSHEYPDFEPSSFSPPAEQIKSAGHSVLGLVKDSSLGVSRVVIEAWKDTTFLLREGETPQPVPPIAGEELHKVGSYLDRLRIKLVLSSAHQEGASYPKEFGQTPENESRRVVSELANCVTEILGYKEPIIAEVEFPLAADTAVSVEFDCETKPGTSIPENVRKYMAESVLHLLDSSKLTKEGSGEVWIRQGKPDTKVFDVV